MATFQNATQNLEEFEDPTGRVERENEDLHDESNSQDLDVPAERLSNWFSLTALPTIALSLYTNKDKNVHVKWFGEEEFDEFANNSTVAAEFKRLAFKAMQRKLNTEQPPVRAQVQSAGLEIDRYVLAAFRNTDVFRMQIDEKRKLIVQAVQGNDPLKRMLWHNAMPVHWWPIDTTPFRSPNKNPKLNVMELDIILQNWQHRILENEDGNVAVHSDQAREEPREGSDEEDDGAERGQEEEQRQEGENMRDEQHEEGRDGCDSESTEAEQRGEREQQGENTRGERREEGRGESETTEKEQRNRRVQQQSDSMLEQNDRGMKKGLKRKQSKPKETKEKSKVHCSKTRVQSDTSGIDDDSNHAELAFMEMMRNKCGESAWVWIKLAAIRYGPEHEDTVLTKIADCGIDLEQLYFLITADDEPSYADTTDPALRFSKCIRKELVLSSQEFRYGTFLHLVLVSELFGINIRSYCKYNLLNMYIDGGYERDVSVLWAPASFGSNEMNHVVPLLPITPGDAESNEVGAGCKNYVYNFPDDQKLQFVACKYCFRKFHLECCALDNAHITECEWDCNCYVKRDTFTSLAKLTSTSELQLCLQQPNSTIKKYITNISKDKVYSPYMGLFKFKHRNALRDLAIERFQFGTNLHETKGEESPDDVITDYAMRIGMQLSKFKGISLSDRVTLNINVLAPEVLRLKNTLSSFPALLIYKQKNEFHFVGNAKLEEAFRTSKEVHNLINSAISQNEAHQQTQTTISEKYVDDDLYKTLIEKGVPHILMDDLRWLDVNYTTGGKRVSRFWGITHQKENKPEWWPAEVPFSSPNIRERDATEGKTLLI
eukprot:gene13059-14403_t